MNAHQLIQSTPEWHAHRASHFNASDAAAMMGCNPYKTRTQLLHEMHTGLTPEVNASTQRRFDDGHRFEALARPLAEAIIGEELYPVVGSEGKLSASFDGLTMLEDTAFEHKTLNAELHKSFNSMTTINPAPIAPKNHQNFLAPMYRIQMEQQCLISGAGRVLFMASKWDGEDLIEERHCWYLPDAKLRTAIIAGWAQFEIDLAAYIPSMIVEMPKAEVTLALPALFIHAKGEITTSNMKEYGTALAARLDSIRKIALVTDQDFSNAKESAKLLRENIEQAKLAKDAMLAQTLTVGEAARMIDAWCEDMRLTALQLEKDVEREDKAKKANMVWETKAKYYEHVQELEKDTDPSGLSVAFPVFADALKNKRSFVSMQESLDTMLANAKIAADRCARAIRVNLDCFKTDSAGFEFLFADKLVIIHKPLDDLKLLVRTRIADHQAAEAEKEQAKAEAAAWAKLSAEQAEAARLKAIEEKRVDEAAAAELAAAKTQANGAALSPAAQVINESEGAQRFAIMHPTATVVTMLRPAPPAASPAAAPTLKLGQIGERLGFSLTGDFLKSLGFEPAARDKSALLFHEASFTHICAALVTHINNIQTKQAA